MDAAHRAASLAVSCLRRPVDPRTRAPIALYERERGRPADGLEKWQNSLHPEGEQSSGGHTDCKDWIDMSKMYLSNQEYYSKLEELKNAHLETMAKLESMYQNKLYLKGVQPLTNTDTTHSMSYRSTYGMNSFHNEKIRMSFSEPDLNNYFHSSLSDTSDEELDLAEDDKEKGLLTFQKEQIENVCDRCSPRDYSYCTENISSILQTLKKTRKKKKKKWSPKITVPQPFQMTIREAKKKQQNFKSKSLIELENNLLKKQLEEEAECQKKFRASPVPAYVFVPLYHEIMQENEERRKSLRERRREVLLAMQKPFKFIEREAQKKELRKVQLKDLSLSEKAKIFKAKPVPKFIYSSKISEKLKEEELYREIRIQMRSEELLRNSSLPSNRLGNKGANKHREQCCLDHSEELESKPRPKIQVPDFETLHKKFQKQLQRQKNVKHTTVCEPFSLHTANISSNKEKILEDIQMDEEKLKETRWPYASSRYIPQMRNLNTNLFPLGCEPTSPRITESTRRRLQTTRDSAVEKRKVEEEQKRRRAKQKQRTRELQRLISIRAEANDPHQSLAQMYTSKLKTFRKHEKQRMKEYLRELEEMEERLEKRPLLLEQATQKNARIAAEKHYSDILHELGLCEEFVSKKGQSATEMLLQGHSSDGSETLAAADIRSDNEDKIEDKQSQGVEEEESQFQSIQPHGEEEEEEEEEEEQEEEEDAEQEDAEAQSDHGDQDASEYENENYEEDSIGKSRDCEN